MEEVVLRVQSTFSGSGNADKIVKHYQRVPFLVIDELEKFKATEWSAPLVFSVLNGRHGNQMPTVITTNFTGDKMYQALAEGGGKELAASLLSRLADRSNTHITLDGEDRRLK